MSYWTLLLAIRGYWRYYWLIVIVSYWMDRFFVIAYWKLFEMLSAIGYAVCWTYCGILLLVIEKCRRDYRSLESGEGIVMVIAIEKY